MPPLPPDWKQLLEQEAGSAAYRQLETFLEREAADGQMLLPPQPDIFRAFELTPYHSVKVLLLGQDPYHTPGMAHGLCFSVQPHVRSLPPSLRNIFRELHHDVGCRIPDHGCLEHWARQGILMLNAALTVRTHSPNSHRQPWQFFTDSVIRLVNAKTNRVVFVLWGGEAKKKQALVTNPRHVVISCAHPSPLSAKKFFGSRSFSRINQALREVGESPIDWQIPDRCTTP
ncbi:MAG: uracil-DNA glycosylase [Nitrospira sp.]|nr:uracil-DNA glycosylase [Nitrospira sp.]